MIPVHHEVGAGDVTARAVVVGIDGCDSHDVVVLIDRDDGSGQRSWEPQLAGLLFAEVRVPAERRAFGHSAAHERPDAWPVRRSGLA